MDIKKGRGRQMTVVEGIEKLEELKQRLIDENYLKLIEDGEAEVVINFETLEALDAVLQYLDYLSKTFDEEDKT